MKLETTGDVPAARSQASMQVTGSKKQQLLLFGGKNELRTFCDIYILDLPTRVWKHIDIAPSPSPSVPLVTPIPLDMNSITRNFRLFASLGPIVKYGLRYFMFGGINSQRNACNDMYTFDLITRQWTLVKTHQQQQQQETQQLIVPPARTFHTMIENNGKLIVSGGCHENNSIYQCDIDQVYPYDYINSLNTIPEAYRMAPIVQHLQAEKSQQQSPQNQNQNQLLLLSQCQLNQIKTGTDYTLVCNIISNEQEQQAMQQRHIAVHKRILSLACPYFNAMFNSGMQESSAQSLEISTPFTNTSNTTIGSSSNSSNTGYHSFENFYTILQYLYTGNVTITHQNAIPLLIIANEYNEQSLQYRISYEYIVSELSHDNIVDMLQLHEKYGIEALKYPLLNYIVSHYHDKQFEQQDYASFHEFIKNSSKWSQLVQQYL